MPSNYNGKSYQINQYAFIGCGSLMSVVIPDGVTCIGDYAFQSCTNLTSVTIGDKVDCIGTCAFLSCKNLLNVVIPESVTSIGDSAFNGCSSLTSIVIPNSVTSIGYGVFGACFNLNYNVYQKGKYLGNSQNPYFVLVDTVDTDFTTFTIHNDTRFIGGRAFDLCNSLVSVSIPDSVTTICDYAFSECKSLTSITIPNNVTSIGKGVFLFCESLETITVDQRNNVYHSTGNCVIETASKTVVAGCKSSVIPNDGIVTSIAEEAFLGSSFATFTIPDGVTSIGNGAFGACNNLTTVVLPDSVTSIGMLSFEYCDSLVSIIIPDSVTSIGALAFRGCGDLTIYCEAQSQPSGWDLAWNSDSCPVVWEYQEK